MKSKASAVATLVFLTGIAVLAISVSGPPNPVPASAPLTEFSSARAMRHVEVIAANPHSIGSQANAAVRDYITSQLRAMGLEPEIQETTAVSEVFAAAGIVQNVVAIMKGTSEGRAVLLASHYDSIPVAPGAGDDGAGAAAMLETLRALKAGPPLQNDVIFLFSDGEEAGLLGSAAFADEHPWAKNVGVALNFEGRGSSGPTFMFETSPGNGRLIEQLNKAAPFPRASSLTYAVYKRLGYDSDFTNFKLAGMSGLNFAFFGSPGNYHTRNDRPEKLSEASLQHHGSYQLALTRHFANRDLDAVAGEDAVYFNFGALLVHYPESWTVPLAILTTALFVVVGALGLKRGAFTASRAVFGALASLLGFVVVLIIGLAVSWLIKHAHGWFLPAGDSSGNGWYALSLVFLTIALVSTLQVLLRTKPGAESLAFGVVFWCVILAGFSAVMLKDASYLFVWPAMFSLCGLDVLLEARRRGFESMLVIGTVALSAVPVLFLLAPMVDLAFAAFGAGWMGAAAIVCLTSLSLGLMVPQLEIITRATKWLLPAAAALSCIVTLVGGALTTQFDADHPLASNVLYALNSESGKAVWASFDERQNSWSAQYLSGSPTRGPLRDFFSDATFLQHEAPSVELAPPLASTIEDKTNDGIRLLRLRIISQRRAERMTVSLPLAEVLSSTVNGKPLRDDAQQVRISFEDGWRLHYANVPEAGFELTIKTRAAHSLKFTVVDSSGGLPETPGEAYSPRPSWIVPIHLGDVTMVSKSFTF
jgi:peptidase M28-like protein